MQKRQFFCFYKKNNFHILITSKLLDLMVHKGGKGKTLTLKKKWMMVMARMSLCTLCEIKLDGDQERKRPVGWMFLHCVLLLFCITW